MYESYNLLDYDNLINMATNKQKKKKPPYFLDYWLVKRLLN